MFISIILIISINNISFAANIASENRVKPLHYMGLKTESLDFEYINQHKSPANTSITVELPSRVDNSHLYPTPMEQTQPDCVAWAVGYACMSALQTYNRNWTVNTESHTFSPAFLYNCINDGNLTGAFIAEGMNSAITTGICPISYYAIDNAYNQPLTNLATECASLYKASSFYVTSTQTQIKQALAEGNGVIIGIAVYEEMYYHMSESNYIYNDITGEYIAGHAICLVGYDDSENAFIFINSWDPDWCLDGFGMISYDLVADDNINTSGANAGYVMNFPTTDNYVMGDANLDNTITAADGRLALRFSAGVESPTDRQYVLSDVDGNGTVTAADASNILNYASGTLTKFPLYE